MRGHECMATYDPILSELNKCRNCFLITLNILLSLLMQSFSIENVWKITTVIVKSCEQLHLVDPVICSFTCQSYFVMTALFFSTQLVIPCFYIQIFLIVVNLLVDWELIPYMNKFLLFCSCNLLWVEIFPTCLIFNLLCFKVCQTTKEN